MSSKFFILFCFLIFGCGVKSPPIPPKGSALPSYVDHFLEKPEDVSEKEDEKSTEQKKNESSENVTP